MTGPAVNRHRVIRRLDLSSEVFELVVERGEVVFTAGENLTIFNAAGTVSRPYSIASGADEPELRFLIRRMPGGQVSNYLGGIAEGEEISATPPFGWFRPGGDGDGAPFVCIATGTGIAPFLAQLRSAGAPRPTSVLYGVRRRQDAAAVAELREAVTDFRLFVSREESADAVGKRVTEVLPELALAPDCHVYLCGLDAMIDDVTDFLEAQGMPFEQIHREVFFHAET